MKQYTVLVFILLTVQMQAQYVELPEKSEKNKNELRKNSIGLGMNPLAVAALGVDASDVHYGLQYKRLLNENRLLRVTGFIQSHTDAPALGAPIARTDSTLFVRSEYDRYEVTEFRVGMEWSNYKERFDGFYGFDLITGIDRQTGFESIHEYTYSGENAPNLYGNKIGSDTLTYFTDDYLMIGFAPFFGYRVGIGQRVDLTAWLSPEFVYLAPIKSNTHDVPQVHRQNASINFRLRLLDLMLSYKF
jgi:hypothetical protein